VSIYKYKRADFNNFYSIFLTIKQEIDRLLLQDTNTNITENPSVDILKIARNVGITIINYVPAKAIFEKHAILNVNKILVNNNDSHEEQRFSIAHEIAHFIFEKREDNSKLFAARSDSKSHQISHQLNLWMNEEIADYFAANLLIPTERFILWEDKSHKEIANAFNVSVNCIKKRRMEVEYELDFMAPEKLSSDVIIKNQIALSFAELIDILGKFQNS